MPVNLENITNEDIRGLIERSGVPEDMQDSLIDLANIFKGALERDPDLRAQLDNVLDRVEVEDKKRTVFD